MRFGLALPQYDYSLPGSRASPWESVREWAVRAEGLGFDSVWLSDHLFYDLTRYGGPQGPRSGVECFTGLAALSLETTRVRLGSLVVNNDLRNPALLAKVAATIDLMSGGRLDLGMGAGWFEPEYRAAGIPFEPPAVRVGRLSEAVRIVRSLLAGGRASFEGRHYRLEGVRSFPLPAAAPPVFVGGRGDRMARLAGRYADGYNGAWAWEPEDFAGRVELVDRAAAAAGRDSSQVKKTVGLYALPAGSSRELAARWRRYVEGGPPGRPEHVSLPLWSSDKLAGFPWDIAERIGSFEALGVTEVILNFGTIPFQICDPEAVVEFMETVVPLLM